MAIIELSGITLRRESQTLLRDISWTVNSSEHWVILGANGAGKTMLLNIITGYLWSTEGTVTVTGKRFGEYDLRELRKTIGYVSSFLQEQLYRNERAVDVVVSGKYASIGLWEIPAPDDYTHARELLEEWNCLSLAEKSYRILSQGEKQKILICRSLMSNPLLLILDEPCVGLDIRSREQVLSIIQALGEKPEGPSLLFVTHHVEEIMPVFTHVLILKKGSAIALGPKHSVLTGTCLSHAFDLNITLMENKGRYHAVIA